MKPRKVYRTNPSTNKLRVYGSDPSSVVEQRVVTQVQQAVDDRIFPVCVEILST